MSSDVSRVLSWREGDTEPIDFQLLDRVDEASPPRPTDLLIVASDVEVRFYAPKSERRWVYTKVNHPNRVSIVDAAKAIVRFVPTAMEFSTKEEPILMRIVVVRNDGVRVSFPRDADVEIRVLEGY